MEDFSKITCTWRKVYKVCSLQSALEQRHVARMVRKKPSQILSFETRSLYGKKIGYLNKFDFHVTRAEILRREHLQSSIFERPVRPRRN